MAKRAIMGLDPKRRTKELHTEEEVVKPVSKVIHHKLFIYPRWLKHSPSLEPFFDKLKEIKRHLNGRSIDEDKCVRDCSEKPGVNEVSEDLQRKARPEGTRPENRIDSSFHSE
jgi:hypothetical protein